MIDPTAPLTSAEHLSVGDVVQIAVMLKDKRTGDPFWWKRFAAVHTLFRNDMLRFYALSLKLDVDLDRDLREIDLRESQHSQVVTWLPPDRWPQGVIAMHMKLIHLGHLKMED